MKLFYLILCMWSSFALAQEEQILRLPERAQNALTGSAFMAKIARLGGGQREKAMVEEILKGNVPSFLRKMTPVESTIPSGPLKGKTMRFFTLPDYLAIGSDRDYIRVPLNMHSIEKITEKLDMSLPTAKMVDDIYNHANVHFIPHPIVCKRDITSTANIVKHDEFIKEEMDAVHYVPGQLIAGHKKDVVQSLKVLRKPGSIAIYGWHRSKANPIQPLSTAHGAEYADYSHGIRLVSNVVMMGETVFDLRDLLENKSYASLLSREGTIPQLSHVRVSASSIALASHP